MKHGNVSVVFMKTGIKNTYVSYAGKFVKSTQ